MQKKSGDHAQKLTLVAKANLREKGVYELRKKAAFYMIYSIQSKENRSTVTKHSAAQLRAVTVISNS